MSLKVTNDKERFDSDDGLTQIYPDFLKVVWQICFLKRFEKTERIENKNYPCQLSTFHCLAAVLRVYLLQNSG